MSQSTLKQSRVLGGNNRIVELNESLFIHVKHGKGKDFNGNLRINVYVLTVTNCEGFFP